MMDVIFFYLLDPRFLSFISYIAGEKATKGLARGKSIFTRRFDQTALISLGVLIEELVRDMIQTWATTGHPLIPTTKRCISTALNLQLQGLSTVSTIKPSNSKSGTEGGGIREIYDERETYKNSNNNNNNNNDKDNTVVEEGDENENIKGALKSMLRVLFLTKEEEEGDDNKIGQIIDNFVDNIGGSLDLSRNNVLKSRNKSKNCTADLIPKSEIVSNSQSLVESVCTFVDYFPCKYCPVILDSRNKLWQHVKIAHNANQK
jgi:hypothetical protein